jgi:hypothetical protein
MVRARVTLNRSRCKVHGIDTQRDRGHAGSMRPVLVVNPRSDETFARLAETLLANGADTPADLESRLAPQYPKARVRARSLSNEPTVIWYVYREGSWTPSTS